MPIMYYYTVEIACQCFQALSLVLLSILSIINVESLGEVGGSVPNPWSVQCLMHRRTINDRHPGVPVPFTPPTTRHRVVFHSNLRHQ